MSDRYSDETGVNALLAPLKERISRRLRPRDVSARAHFDPNLPDDRTRVYLTVDTECAEERNLGGRTQPAMGYDLRVWGRFDNRDEELGVPLIMSELEAYGMRGTFYTEAIGAHHFGKAGLREVCQQMLSRGHDVQLHVHPVQRRALLEGGKPSASDNISAYPLAEQTALLSEGMDLLAEAGVPRESIRSYRAGNFGASNLTWQAMAQAGLTLSSNYNPCYFDINCEMRSPDALAGLFRTEIDGVWELPITNFRQPGGGHRHLQVMAVSLAEMIHSLRACRARGIRHVTFVTHSFEFFHIDSIEGRRGHKNLINIARLRGLLEYLRGHEDEFVMETVGELAARLPEEVPDVREYPAEPRALHLMRLVEQGVKRMCAHVPLP
ncbi:MAG: hypothetical protein R3B07_03470 [Polyangiaceae bacterium]